ncbi:adenylate kinase [Angustibacter speluncae]
MRLLILGPPGAGKGTQAVRVAERFGVPAISTGDIFRQNIRDETPLGQKVKAIIDSGQYVPDEVTNDLVRDRLAQDDARGGFLLDGYPRTADQVRELDDVLAAQGLALQHVLELTVDTEEVVARLLKRAETDGRSDDTEDVIRTRQQVYADQTAPLLDVYRERGLLVQVDGTGEVDEVTERVLAALDGRRAPA